VQRCTTTSQVRYCLYPGFGRQLPSLEAPGRGQEARWATIYASVADMDQILCRAEKLGGSRISDPGLSALKSAARAAIYVPGSVDDHMETGAFRDPAGNVFGVYHAED
jgi:predicted enzyme related to lactoylglutathione lyase